MDINVISNPEISFEYDESPSLGHLLVENLTKAAEKVILTSSISGEELSASELLTKSIAVAQSLKVFSHTTSCCQQVISKFN